MKKIWIPLLGLMLLLSGCRGSVEVTNPLEENNQAQATSPAPTTQTTQPATTTPAFEEQVLVETDSVLMKLTGVEDDPIWGYTLKVYLENRTDRKLMFSVEDASVNGFMCDPFWATEVTGGMKANQKISFSVSDFEENGIQEVKNIRMTLHVYDSDDWEAEDYVNQEVEISL